MSSSSIAAAALCQPNVSPGSHLSRSNAFGSVTRIRAMLLSAMGSDGTSVDDERTVTAAVVAAVAPFHMEGRGEDGKACGGIAVTRPAVGDRPRMQLDDLGVAWVRRRQPLRGGRFEMVIAKLHHDVQRYLLGSLTTCVAELRCRALGV